MKHSSSAQQQIPDKVYFRIGEVSRLVGVDTHVLRYWETEFPRVKPHRARSKQRLYRRQDVELLLRIKCLLHEEGYTISGARKLLKNTGQQGEHPARTGAAQAAPAALTYIKHELQAILETLGKAQ